MLNRNSHLATTSLHFSLVCTPRNRTVSAPRSLDPHIPICIFLRSRTSPSATAPASYKADFAATTTHTGHIQSIKHERQSTTHTTLAMPPAPLTLSKPYKSSHLALPPSPFSPRFPISPPLLPPRPTLAPTPVGLILTSPPPKPLHWLWQCHLCARVYRLGTTRRCLDDGHFFCAGTTTTKRSRKSGRVVRRHKACASEFDYGGWKAWGGWRRDCREQREAAGRLGRFLDDGEEEEVGAPGGAEGVVAMMMQGGRAGARGPTDAGAKDCWNTCDYPSECRWGKQYGVSTPVVSPPSPPSRPTAPSAPTTAESGFADILISISDLTGTLSSPDEIMSDISFSPDLDPEHPPSPSPTPAPTSPVDEKKPSMTDLLESAKRRKRKSAGGMGSPLALNPPSLEASLEAESSTVGETGASLALQKALDDFDVDFRKSSFGRRAVSSLFGRRDSSGSGSGSGTGRRSGAGST